MTSLPNDQVVTCARSNRNAARHQIGIHARHRRNPQSVLTSHVLPGRVTAAEIAAAVKGGRGKATYITADGGVLTFRKRGNGWQGQDAKGNYANITGDVIQSNGVVHVLDTVLLP